MTASMNPLRIAVLTATFPPYYAGAGNTAYHQAAGLAERGHDVTVMTATYPGESDDPKRVSVVRLKPLLRLGNAPLLYQLPSLLKEFDVIHLHQPFIFGSELAATAARLKGIPLVSTIHNALLAEGWRGRLFDGYSRTALPLTLRASSIIVGLTEGHAYSVPQVARELTRHPDKLRIVAGAVDTDEFSPAVSTPVWRERLGIPAEATVVMLCAVLDEAHRFKRVDLAIAAAGRVEGLHLLIVGRGPLAGQLSQQAAGLDISDRVHLVGFQPDLAECYRAADALLICSDKLESFGLVQVEAMACERPVIVCDLPGVRDVSIPGVHGFHVRAGDEADLVEKLRAFCSLSAEQRRAMGVAAREHVLENFTWTRSVDALEVALRAAATGPRAGVHAVSG
jgi:glycosyltransferase involved in cell wall biosynthesis